ncbi:hypothetical protein CH330_00020 [candidate division WOR-3 bacterium JGI_Cruoil_03_51_56]|uniref:Uncharacterized protein n=1 Tax=candidate division WOR-3 bacterium JGI_Cruoil_03_51_56 TaxID=1973747 RepID=A0A235BYW5_UNCW3|nr:MAG: hypothetical protein CH330_00020 [candidate division WOR-3 bacterium JGI_Cruoil_03_51_56]
MALSMHEKPPAAAGRQLAPGQDAVSTAFGMEGMETASQRATRGAVPWVESGRTEAPASGIVGRQSESSHLSSV